MADIVTVPVGIGNGPAVQNAQVINAKWNNATNWFAQAFAFGDAMKADVGTAPGITAPSLVAGITAVEPPEGLSFDDPNAAMAYFDEKNGELSALIDEAFQKILGVAFPDMSLMADAMAWCKRAINGGGTGINTTVEAALWERGRARIIVQAERDVASTQEKYARTGWPLPPGAMLHEAAMIRQDSRNKLAEVSRDIAIKSFDTEIENVRFAVKTVGDLFGQALNAVGEYVKTVMMGPQVAAQLATSMSGLKNEASRTLVALYQAQSAALDPFVRMNITDAELKERAAEANLRAKMETASLRAQAVLANVKMVGDAAAASFNGISSGVSNTVSTSISE